MKKKIPLRMCTGCGEMKPKKELVRVVKSPDKQDENENIIKGEVSLDLTGKKPGRGAYICKDKACLQKARKARRFEKTFSMQIPSEIYDLMEEEIGE